MNIIQERSLVFQFPDAVHVERLDRQNEGIHPPHGMRAVDFIIEEETRTILVEVEDYPDTDISRRDVNKKIVELSSGNKWVNEESVVKARDSYTYLHLMARDSKPIDIVFLLAGLENRVDTPQLMMILRDKIERRLAREESHVWQRVYIRDCAVLSESMWLRVFPKYTLHRLPPPN